MDRRKFLKTGLLAGASLTVPGIYGNYFAKSSRIPPNVFDLVAIKNGEPEVMFDRGIEQLGGMKAFVKKNQNISLKSGIRMGILDDALQSVTKSMILKSIKLDRIDTQHIVKQKMGNNPIEKFADDNIYDVCAAKNIDKLIIGGYGEKSEVGLGAMRDIDYASYVTKMAVAIKDIPLVRTNGPFSNATSELLMFLNIWKKYYGTRVDHHRISGKEEATNPLTIISAMIYKNDKNIRLEMLIANSKLVETNPGELKYFGDLILFATEKLGYGKSYTQSEKYSENHELRTTLSALTGKSEYGQKLLRTVEQSFENLDFIRKDLEAIRPNISIIQHMLWVSNIYKQK